MVMRRLATGLALLAFLAAACSTDPAGLDRGTNETAGGPSLVNSGLTPDQQAAAAIIEAQLTCLYTSGLTPNKRSTLGKFDQIQKQIVSGDLDGAKAGTINLIAFIINKYEDFVAGGGDPTAKTGCTNTVTVNGVVYNLGNYSFLELKDGVIDGLGNTTIPGVQSNLLSFVGLEDLCFLNDGQFCKTTQEQGGFVYFPTKPAGVSYVNVLLDETSGNLQGIFDEYPNLIQIKLYDAAGIEITGLTLGTPATVVVCFNTVTPPPTGILGRLRLLTEHNGQAKFLPLATLSPEIIAYGNTLCGPPPSPSAGFNLSAGTSGPQLAGSLAFGGVGGSAEEFSPFTIGDPGLAFGGVGGSAEEFAPGIMPSGPATVSGYSGLGTTWYGQVGDAEVVGTIDPATGSNLPSVLVKTVQGDSTNGVLVTFTLKATDGYTPTSLATLCGAGGVTVHQGGDSMYVQVQTGAQGYKGVAFLPCLDFGDEIGYKKLRVTFDPSTVPGSNNEACMIASPTGDCLTDPFTNFLIQTVAGAPSKLAVVSDNPTTEGKAGTVFGPFKVQVQDNNGNAAQPLPGGTLPTWTVTVNAGAGVELGGAGLGCAKQADNSWSCSDDTDGSGLADFTGLTVAGRLGPKTLTFSAVALTSTTAAVTVNAPGDAALLQVVTAPVAGRLDEPFGTMPRLRVTDAWANPVSGATVTVTKVPGYTGVGSGKLVCVNSGVLATDASGCSTATMAEVQVSAAGVVPAVFDTLAVFDKLTITDLTLSGAPTQYLRFTSGTTKCGTDPTLGYCDREVAPTAGAPVFTKVCPPGGCPNPDFANVTAFGTAVTAQVKVADKYGNPYGTGSNAITWVVQKTGFGSVVSPTSSSAAAGTGLSSTAWTLGDDGTNTLTATWNGTATGWSGTLPSAAVNFSATTAPAAELFRACVLGSPTKKLDLGSFASGTYTAWYTIEGTTAAPLPNVIRSLSLWMSITGQSSSTASYPAQIEVFDFNTGNVYGDATRLASALFNNSVNNGGVLGDVQLPGDNGNPVEVKFHLNPVKARTAAKVVVKLQFRTNDASRTPQVWLNSKTTTGDYCSRSVGYAAGTSPTLFTSRDLNKGVVNRISNWNKDYKLP